MQEILLHIPLFPGNFFVTPDTHTSPSCALPSIPVYTCSQRALCVCIEYDSIQSMIIAIRIVILEVEVNERRSGLTFVIYGSPSRKHTAHTISTRSSLRYFVVRLPKLSSMAVTRTSTEANCGRTEREIGIQNV